jgi:hypothetical protein
MRCLRCGKELGDSKRCIFCGYENKEGNVREMSSVEKNFYDGITIDEGEVNNQHFADDNSYHSANNYRSRRTIYIAEETSFFSRLLNKLFNGLINNNLIAKIAVTFIVVAILLLTFFVALPILFVLLAAGIAMLIFSKLGK